MGLCLPWLVGPGPGVTGLRAASSGITNAVKHRNCIRASPETLRQLQGVQEGKQLLLLFRRQPSKATGNLPGFPPVTQDCILQR